MATMTSTIVNPLSAVGCGRARVTVPVSTARSARDRRGGRMNDGDERPHNAARRARGPASRSVVGVFWDRCYQTPPVLQEPLPAVVQPRVGAPPPTFSIQKSLPDFEYPVTL
jgi:hypothetical protein